MNRNKHTGRRWEEGALRKRKEQEGVDEWKSRERNGEGERRKGDINWSKFKVLDALMPTKKSSAKSKPPVL